MSDKSKDNPAADLFFNKKALQHFQSPEDLEKHLRVSTPGSWILIAACIVLIAGFVIWGIFGLSTKSSSLRGVWADDGFIVVFADADTAVQLDPGDPVYVGGEMFTIDHIDYTPMDAAKLEETSSIKPLYAEFLTRNGMNYLLFLKGENKKDHNAKILDVTVITDQQSPIQLLFGRAKQ